MSPDPIFELGPFAKLPTRGSPGSGGLDLYASAAVRIPVGATVIVPTGLKCKFNHGWVALVWDRSGMGSRGIHRFAGVIDSDYRGFWGVVIHNSSGDVLEIKIGDRIAQVLFQQVWMGTPMEGFVSEQGRGGGFGSTGR